MKEKLEEIYQILEEEYGFQRWWPTISNSKRFETIIGAILTQNTSWNNVEKAIKNLDKFNFLRKDALKQLNEEDLAQLIRSSGYFNQKAKKIKKVIEFLDSGKEINRENLLGVWGIGKETADSILLYAYDKPEFVIDSYTKRIFSRMGIVKDNIDYDELKELFTGNIENNIELYKEYHALIVNHGKDICRKNPKCHECCLRKICEYGVNIHQMNLI
ncbi:endonuclease [Candidatus Woesearchaeota archaeon]|nr:endonuclease [Candidatus Woesearchaeota archaeon]